MSVPRYIATRVRPGSTVNAVFEPVVVLFTDHEAALAAARDEALQDAATAIARLHNAEWSTPETGLEHGCENGAQHDALIEAAAVVAALRKPTPQPEPPCQCWLCHDANLTCDKCENCIVQTAAQPEGGDDA